MADMQRRLAGHGSASSPAAQQPSSPPTADVSQSLKGSEPGISKSGPHKSGELVITKDPITGEVRRFYP
jgi:hypothetical protein